MANKFTTIPSGPIGIVALGPVPPADIDLVASEVRRLTGVEPKRLPSVEDVSSRMDRVRLQLDADRLLIDLFNILSSYTDLVHIVGIVDADMFSARRTFVFGYAHLRDGMALVSLARLRDGDRNRFRARVRRVLTHELGHVWGCFHHEDTSLRPRPCIMRNVADIKQEDALPLRYCPACLGKLRPLVARSIAVAAAGGR